MNSSNSYKLIMLMAIAVGSFLLYLVYLVLFTPNGLVGLFS